MAEVRYVKTKIWRDTWFFSLSMEAKYLFLFVVTNEATRLAGFYEMNIDRISLDTKIPMKKLKTAFKEIEARVAYVDGWVCIKNYAQHQNAANSPKVQSLIEKELELIPEHVQNTASEQFASHSNSYSNSYSNSVPIDRVSIPYEKEQKSGKAVDKETYGELHKVKLYPEEYAKLVERFGEKNTHVLIDELDTYIASKGKKYASHYATLLNWARRKIQDYKQNGGQKPKVI